MVAELNKEPHYEMIYELQYQGDFDWKVKTMRLLFYVLFLFSSHQFGNVQTTNWNITQVLNAQTVFEGYGIGLFSTYESGLESVTCYQRTCAQYRIKPIRTDYAL
eukprot:27360_1